MKLVLVGWALTLSSLLLLATGCGDAADDSGDETSSESTSDRGGESTDDGSAGAMADGGTQGETGEIAGGTDEGQQPPSPQQVTMLSAENASIQFIGRHVDPAKEDRHGGFNRFTGQLQMEEDALKSLSLEVETESIETTIDQLTNHLKGSDFFNVRLHPAMTFQSTEIAAGETEGTYQVTGTLTMLDVTKEVSFPATVTGSGDSAKLVAEFDIDRNEFGMTYGPDNIQPEVSITFSVGE